MTGRSINLLVSWKKGRELASAFLDAFYKSDLCLIQLSHDQVQMHFHLAAEIKAFWERGYKNITELMSRLSITL